MKYFDALVYLLLVLEHQHIRCDSPSIISSQLMDQKRMKPVSDFSSGCSLFSVPFGDLMLLVGHQESLVWPIVTLENNVG